jgi:signal transduction histidine kinase
MPGTTIEPTTDRNGHTPWPARAPRRPASYRSPRSLSTASDGAANAAVLQERARIARELHDSVSQTLYAISLTAARALQHLNQTDAQALQQSLADVLGLATTGQSELRSLLADVRSDQVVRGGLTASLARLAADVSARHARVGLDIRLALGEEPEVPAATKEALLLISREALQNVVKHGAADRVDIVLRAEAECLVLDIADNGRGFNPAVPRPGHFGLQSMRERASAVGGVLTLVSRAGLGTQVHVHVPRASGH